MSLEQQIAKERAEREATFEQVQTLLAKLSGHDATIKSLESRLQPSGNLAEMNRSEAIIDVLRTAANGLGPTEILHALKAGGRDDELRFVTATLDYLCRKKRANRIRRGCYISL